MCRPRFPFRLPANAKWKNLLAAFVYWVAASVLAYAAPGIVIAGGPIWAFRLTALAAMMAAFASIGSLFGRSGIGALVGVIVATSYLVNAPR
jgi:hypothetical protein